MLSLLNANYFEQLKGPRVIFGRSALVFFFFFFFFLNFYELGLYIHIYTHTLVRAACARACHGKKVLPWEKSIKV